MQDMDICHDIESFSRLKDQWQVLHSEDSKASLSNSWEWISTWLTIFWQQHYDLQVLLFKEQGVPVAIIPLYFNPDRKSFYLLGTGEPESCEVSSEYVDILVHDDYPKDPFYLHIARYMQSSIGSTITIVNCIEDSHIFTLSNCFKYTFREETGRIFRMMLDANFEKVISRFSTNQRKKSRSLVNRFNNHSSLQFHAEDEGDFKGNWQVLRELHQKDWQARGKPGAMNEDEFNAFHSSLHENYPYVRQYFSRLTFNNEVIAINHYYDWAGVRYFYLAGSVKDSHQNLSPGNLLHTLAIASLCGKAKFYDFMKGSLTGNYKSGFCTPGQFFYTITIYCSNSPVNVMYLLTKIKKFLKKLLHR